MKRWIFAGLCLVLFIFAMAGWWSTAKLESVPDELRIRQLIADGQQAIMDRNLRAAMECVSSEYRDPNGLTHATLRAYATHALKSASGYEVFLDTPDIEFTGTGKAVARTRVEVVAYTGGLKSPPIGFDATIELAREDARRWWVFPVSQWRITSLPNLPIPALDTILQ